MKVRLAAAFAALAVCACVPGSSALATPTTKYVAYVAGFNSSAVRPVDLSGPTLKPTIAVPASPYRVALAPDGQTVWLASVSGAITPIDVATNTAGTPIPVGGAPASIALAHDGTTAYVGDITSPSTIKVVNLATKTVTTVPLGGGGGPTGLAVSPDDSRLYVANHTGGTLVTLNTADLSITGSIDFGAFIDSVVLSPDGTTAYVSVSGAHTVKVIDLSSSTVTDVAVDNDPRSLALTPSGDAL